MVHCPTPQPCKCSGGHRNADKNQREGAIEWFTAMWFWSIPTDYFESSLQSLLVMGWYGSCLAWQTQGTYHGHLGCCVENYSQEPYELGIVVPVLRMMKPNIRKVTALSRVKQPEEVNIGFKLLWLQRPVFFLTSLRVTIIISEASAALSLSVKCFCFVISFYYLSNIKIDFAWT